MKLKNGPLTPSPRAILASILLMGMMLVGCGNTKTYTYNSSKTKERFEDFYLTKTVVGSDYIKIYWEGTMDSLENYHFHDDSVELDGHTIIINTEEPENYTELELSNGDRTYCFRNLYSDMYIALQIDMDSEGGLHVEGDEDTFFTDEEIEASRKRAEIEAKEQESLYVIFEGTWKAEDGSYFSFSKDDTYCLETFWISEEHPNGEKYINPELEFSHFEDSNEYQFSFPYGAMMKCYTIELSESGDVMEVEGKTLTKEL
ncbi:hypothetical protein [Pseudobutyrivibrio sp.]|uniref:hypothetical protein n=1 Tax=Pseudobutyrivibrio sp. TaxID=2014367 RepID=UPI003866F866